MERKAETVDLSIIIVNWNTRDYLRACLQSIYAHPPSKYTFEVIVVDNASADGSVDMVRREFPQVHVIANDYNYGFAKATNQGYRISRGRYVMTLNPDTEVLDGTLDGLVEFLDTHPDAGAVQPYPTFYDSPKRIKSFIFSKMLEKLGNWRWLKRDSDNVREPFEVAWLWGTGITCRRDALGPDSFFYEWSFMYSEEYWLCRRLRERGSRLYAVPNLKIHHIGGASKRRSPECSYQITLLEHAAGYVVRWYGFGSWNARFNAVVHLLDGLIVWPILWLKQQFRKDSLREFALAEWKGVIHGNWNSLLHGEKYFRKVNEDTERFFNRANDGQSV
jgi:GT2 family glycosyltransferase